MTLREIIRETRAIVSGFNPPAGDRALENLRGVVGRIAEDVLEIYRDHDGSDAIPIVDGFPLAARLMPVKQVLKVQAMFAGAKDLPKCGTVLWLWTDDNSNYCGVYADGPLAGWVTVFNHEEPMLVPVFRSVASFMALQLEDAKKDEEERAVALPDFPREIPVVAPDPVNRERDGALGGQFVELYEGEKDDDLRRLHAFCAIHLTPFDRTDDVFRFFEDDDMWIPEEAVLLLQVRHWKRAVSELERLARDGHPNGDSAAMRLLALMDTREARDAIVRLRRELVGTKLERLEARIREWSPPR